MSKVRIRLCKNAGTNPGSFSGFECTSFPVRPHSAAAGIASIAFAALGKAELPFEHPEETQRVPARSTLEPGRRHRQTLYVSLVGTPFAPNI